MIHPGDIPQLTALHNEYNRLLQVKTDIEAAVEARRYTGPKLLLLIDTHTELLRIDNLRTTLSNPTAHRPRVNNIKTVTHHQNPQVSFKRPTGYKKKYETK